MWASLARTYATLRYKNVGNRWEVPQIGLLRDVPRAATVVAYSVLPPSRWTREPFLTAVLRHAPPAAGGPLAAARLAVDAAPG